MASKLDTWIASRMGDSDKADGSKDKAAIESSTADAWAGRALKAWSKYAETEDEKYIARGAEFEAEALEHAGQAEDGKLDEVREMLTAARERYGVPSAD